MHACDDKRGRGHRESSTVRMPKPESRVELIVLLIDYGSPLSAMQISERDLTFNIIYVPGTFKLLRVFLLSLLEHSSSCRFRLVSNGCGDEELRAIQDFCGSYPRLGWQVVGTGAPLAHGEVLSLLQEQEESSLFAFMDSDIFATAPFLENLLAAARGADAIFSCTPFWATDRCLRASRDSMVLSGAFNELADGTCVGTSYFAVYDNQKLSRCRAETAVGLRLYLWRQIPRRLCRELRAAGKVKGIYRHGKAGQHFAGAPGCLPHFQDQPRSVSCRRDQPGRLQDRKPSPDLPSYEDASRTACSLSYLQSGADGQLRREPSPGGERTVAKHGLRALLLGVVLTRGSSGGQFACPGPSRSGRKTQSPREPPLTLIFQTYGRELQRAPAPTGDFHD